MVEGNPTAIKDQSYTSTSSGDEGGTQGGGLITHKTKGKAYFKFWSLDVMIEGLNADAHSDPMAQNCGSSPLNGLCWKSSVVREMYFIAENSDCTKAYDSKKHHKRPNTEQTRQAQAEHASNGGNCWDCGSSTPAPSCKATHVDHQPPLVVSWYAGGCHLTEDEWEQVCLNTRCKPHCASCSHDQSTDMSNFNTDMITHLGL